MKKQFDTAQEEFWSSSFGDQYISRNSAPQLIASSLSLYAGIIKSLKDISSIMEFGANIGLNLLALKQLLPQAELSALEINQKAVNILKKIPNLKVYHTSLLTFKVDYQRELVFTRGVLIHLSPTHLAVAYKAMYETSSRYICIAEYYNPSPVTIPYRGHEDKLFKRDFAGEMLDLYPDLRLIDYGFVYHRDPNFPQDDVTWFLLEKTKEQ